MQRVILLLMLLIFVSNRFYEPFFLGDGNEQLIKLLYYSIFFFLTLSILLNYILKKRKVTYFGSILADKAVGILILGLLISIGNAFFFKGQDISAGLLTSAATLIAYLVYFDLRIISISASDLEMTIKVFGWIYVVCVIIGFLTLPTPLFGSFEFDETHGGMRFALPGIHWMTLMFFCYLGKYNESRKWKFLFFALIALIIVLLSLTRQLIILSIVFGGLYLLKMMSIWKRILFISFFAIFSFGVLSQLQIINNLIELTEEQAYVNESGREDVRVKDYRVFLIDYERNSLQYLFGCGMGSYNRSKYGKELEMMAETEWLIPVDTGWAGFVFYFGYFSAFALLYLILYCLFRRVPPNILYLKYYIAFFALCAIASGTIINPNEYIILMIVFATIASSQNKILKIKYKIHQTK